MTHHFSLAIILHELQALCLKSILSIRSPVKNKIYTLVVRRGSLHTVAYFYQSVCPSRVGSCRTDCELEPNLGGESLCITCQTL